MGMSTTLGNVEVTWLGHAGFRFQTPEVVVYVDPYKVSHGEKADLILLTHDHYDHCDPSSISSLRKEETVIVGPKNCKEKVHGLEEIKLGQDLERKGVHVKAIPAYNKEKHFHPQGAGFGYVFMIGSERIYHAGDTDSIPEMAGLGRINLALLPVGGTYTMNAREAAEAAEKIMPDLAIPMHWGDIVGTRKDAEEFQRLAGVKVRILE
jgi:L-ascorbate metabolism protein UlaG (beta-lactamase superfamily)